MAQAITNQSFDTVVSTESRPVLVDFWASWCGPCRAMSPVVDQLADELSAQLAVYKCNVDEEPALAQRFGIMSIPTLILFKDGKPVHTAVGSRPKADLVAELQPYL